MQLLFAKCLYVGLPCLVILTICNHVDDLYLNMTWWHIALISIAVTIASLFESPPKNKTKK